MAPHSSISDMYKSGEFWGDIPDFLINQAPGKITHLFKLIDFDQIRVKLSKKKFSIVDIGCGAGRVVTGLSDRLHECYHDLEIIPVGYDISPQAIEVAKRQNANGCFVCGDFRKATQIWDLAIVCDVIEHILNPDEFVRSVAERSRYFAIGFCMDDNLPNRLSRTRREDKRRHGHISLFNEKKALALCSKYGKVLKSAYAPKPISANLRITRFRHLFTLPCRLILGKMSRRLKGKLFGGESIYVFAESLFFSESSCSAGK